MHVRAKDPDGAESRETTAEMALASMGSAVENASTAFRFGAAVAEAAEILRGSPYVDGLPNLEAVQAMAQGAAGEDADRLEFVELLGRIMDIWPL